MVGSRKIQFLFYLNMKQHLQLGNYKFKMLFLHGDYLEWGTCCKTKCVLVELNHKPIKWYLGVVLKQHAIEYLSISSYKLPAYL